MQVRFELTQAEDARRYSADGGAASVPARSRLLEAALTEARSGCCSLAEAATLLWLLVSGKLDSVAPEGLWVRASTRGSCVKARVLLPGFAAAR